MSGKQRAIKGVVWSDVERFLVQSIQFVVTIKLARILFNAIGRTDWALKAEIKKKH